MNMSEILKLVCSNLVTLLAAYMMFSTTGDTNDNSLLATILARQEVLEQSNLSLMSKVMALGVENVELRAQLLEKGTRVDLYQTFLDGLPFPAWIKRRDEDGEFRMVMINKAYAYQFGISKERYQGSTDREVWGEYIAEGFRVGDEEVFESKGYLLTREYFPRSGAGTAPAWHSVWKFSLKLSGNEFGVGGIVVVDFAEGDPAMMAVEKSKFRIMEESMRGDVMEEGPLTGR